MNKLFKRALGESGQFNLELEQDYRILRDEFKKTAETEQEKLSFLNFLESIIENDEESESMHNAAESLKDEIEMKTRDNSDKESPEMEENIKSIESGNGDDEEKMDSFWERVEKSHFGAFIDGGKYEIEEKELIFSKHESVAHGKFVFIDEDRKRYKFSERKLSKVYHDYGIHKKSDGEEMVVGIILNKEEVLDNLAEDLILEYLHNNPDGEKTNALEISYNLNIHINVVDEILEKFEQKGIVGTADERDAGQREVKLELINQDEYAQEDINKFREEMLVDLEDKGELQERYDKARLEYLENKSDKNAQSRYEHAAAEFAAADVNSRLDEILKEKGVVEAKLDTKGHRILSKFEKKWQSWEGLNLYDKYLNEKAKDKLYGKVLFHNPLSRFIIKKGASVKMGISLGLAGAGILVGGFGLGLAGATATTIAVRRAFGGAMVGAGVIARIEKTGAKKGTKRIAEVQKMFNVDGDGIFFDQSIDEQNKIISEYQYAAAINNINLDEDPVFQKMVDYRLSHINDLVEVEEKGAENRLVEIKEHLFNDIKEKEDILDQRFSEAGKRRIKKTLLAGVVGAATATLVPKVFATARHSEELKAAAEFIKLDKVPLLNKFFIGDVDTSETISDMAKKVSMGVSGSYEIEPIEITPAFVAQADLSLHQAIIDSNFTPETQQAIQDNFSSLTDSQKVFLNKQLMGDQSLEDIFGSDIKAQEISTKIDTIVKPLETNLADLGKSIIDKKPEITTVPADSYIDSSEVKQSITEESKDILKQSGIEVEEINKEVISEKALKDLGVGDKIESVYEGQFEDAKVPEGKGVIYALYQQLYNKAEDFGYKPGSGQSKASWASEWANKEGMKNYKDTWVEKDSNVAYVLKGNVNDGGLSIHEVNPDSGKIIGETGGKHNDYEMDPIEKETIADEIKERLSRDEKMVEPIPDKYEYPFIEREKEIVDFENQYENATTEAEQKQVIKSFEKSLEKTGKFDMVSGVNNTEMLKDLSKSHNNVLRTIAEDTKEKLLSYGSPTERIGNFLELEKPTENDLRVVQSAFEQHGKEKMANWGEFKRQQANLFAKYVTQSDEIFRKSINGSVGPLDNAFHNFDMKSFSEQSIPNPKQEIWQPKIEKLPDGKGGDVSTIFNVKPQNNIFGSTKYLIDLGDGNEPKAFSEDVLQKVLDGKENFRSSKFSEGNKLAEQIRDLAKKQDGVIGEKQSNLNAGKPIDRGNVGGSQASNFTEDKGNKTTVDEYKKKEKLSNIDSDRWSRL
jgi:hypothetical protein